MSATFERALPGALLAVCIAFSPGSEAAGAAETSAAARFGYLITYVTSTTAYVDAGREAGLEVGDVLEVVAEGAVVAKLEIEAVSSTRASCRRLDPSVELRAGMRARAPQTLGAPPAASAALPVIEAAKSPSPSSDSGGFSSRLNRAGLRGRVGIRYIGVRDEGVVSRTFQQPGIDLRVDGRAIGGSPVGVSVDVRAQRTMREATSQETNDENRTRVYRLSAEWREAGDPFRASVGRQILSTIASIGVFDGAQVGLETRRWTVGGLAGTQPDAVTLDYSTNIREAGAFAEWRSAGRGRTRWSVGLGAFTSQSDGEVHRDFAAVQSSVMHPRATVFVLQEVDWNRGWKREAEGSDLDVTSTFATLRVPAGERWSLNAGYDNRRTVRLFREEITPETEFDDQYRQGVWGGVEARVTRAARMSLSLRRHSGGTSGEARSATLAASLRDDGLREMTPS